MPHCGGKQGSWAVSITSQRTRKRPRGGGLSPDPEHFPLLLFTAQGKRPDPGCGRDPCGLYLRIYTLAFATAHPPRAGHGVSPAPSRSDVPVRCALRQVSGRCTTRLGETLIMFK